MRFPLLLLVIAAAPFIAILAPFFGVIYVVFLVQGYEIGRLNIDMIKLLSFKNNVDVTLVGMFRPCVCKHSQ